ncbi:hypothetical protein GGD50_000916 [Rhizobium paranaense]|uniref:Uncharacterized protein n=1 Tax=Rhizobium paranaense TaxID=1650438 RepID=A0A7W8XN71_9HYPH|nr:hypothetical protein [Rhizobium paranaense]
MTRTKEKSRLAFHISRWCAKSGFAHDDRLDALAMAAAYWVESMAILQRSDGSGSIDSSPSEKVHKCMWIIRGPYNQAKPAGTG